MKKFLLALLLTFLITNLGISQCNPTYNFYQYTCDLNCGLYLNNMPIDPNQNYDQAVIWDFGDGITEPGNYFATQHQYAEAGTYIVTATIMVGECQGQIYTYEFVIEDCNCPSELTNELIDYNWNEFYTTQCSTYELTLGGEDFVFFNGNNNTTVEWDFGDGTEATSSNNSIVHSFESEGEFIVTASFTNLLCTDIVLTDTLNIAFCEGDCAPFEYFEFYQIPGNCNNVNLVLDFNPNTMWFVDGDYVGQGYIVETFLEEGSHEVCMVIAPEPGCPLGSEFCTEIFIECEDDCPSEENFNAYNIPEECNLWEFAIGDNPDIEYVLWDFGDDSTDSTANFTYHLFEEDGEYLVTATCFSDNCPNGSIVLSYLVETQCIDDCEIYVDVYVEENCLVSLFAETNAPGVVQWYIDGEYWGSGDYITYDAPGEHYYCAIFTSGECNYSIEYCGEFVGFCNYDCPTDDDFYAGIVNDNCSDWIFEIGEFEDGELVEWDFGDETFETGGHFVTHSYENPGTYIVSAFYTSNNCIEGTLLEIIVIVEDCDFNCPTYNDITYYSDFDDCNVWNFDFAGNFDGQFTWNFNDGSNEAYGNNVSHEFMTNGYHLISVNYFSEDCSEGVYLEVEIYVNCIECYIDIVYNQYDCDTYVFEAITNPEDQFSTITWLVDGVYISTGNILEYDFTEGYHTVCAITESGFCYTDICLDIEVEDCGDCTTIDFAIDSNVELGGPEEINWMVYNLEDGSIGESGVCYYDDENMYCDPSLCFPDGCYQMVLFVDEGYDWTNITSFPSINGNSIYTYNINSDCNCGILTYDFSINSDCAEEECYLDIQANNIQGNVFGFTANAPDAAVVIWSMGDGTTITGNVINYEYENPGTYEICAFYETENCPEGVESCTTIIVEEDECTEVTISISASIDEIQMEFLQLYLMNEEFEYEGTIPFSSLNGTLDLTFCIPDGCYNFMIVPSDGLFDLIDLAVEVTIDGEIVSSIEDIIGTEPVSVIISVNTVCTLDIAENETQGFEIFPNPASETIQVTTSNNGYDFIQVYNSIGELVISESISSNNQVVEVSSLRNGLYQVVLSGERFLESKSLIILK